MEDRNKHSPGQTKYSMGEWKEGGARSRRGLLMTQATVSMVFHGGGAGGRSHDGVRGSVAGGGDRRSSCQGDAGAGRHKVYPSYCRDPIVDALRD